MKKLILTAVVAAMVGSSAQAQLVNGNFEAGITGWFQYGGGNAVSGGYFGMHPAEGTQYWASVRSWGASPPGGEGVAQQVILPAGTYTLSAMGLATNNNQFLFDGTLPSFSNATWVRLVVDTAGGFDPTLATDIGAQVTTGQHWQQLSLTFTTPGGPTSIWLDSMQTYALAGNWTGFDDAKLEVVPEPSSVLALAGGLFGMVGMLRRKRS